MVTQPANNTNTREPPKVSSHQWEGVRDLSVWGKFCSKAIGWKQFVAVIVLDDVAYRLERHSIHVQLVWIHVVERGGLRWVTCRKTASLLA